MPRFPSDMDKARTYSAKQKAEREARSAKEAEAMRRDEAAIRELANELRRREGLPPLRPDEPVQAIICRRGRR